MGRARAGHRARSAPERTLSGRPATRARAPNGSVDLLALAALVSIIAAAAVFRRDFLGDGVRHVSTVLATDTLPFGEPRWLLFPTLLFTLLRPLVEAGLVAGVEAAVQPILWLSVSSGALFLWSLYMWLRAEGADSHLRAGALLLAGSCAPFLRLYSDVAEPQIAAAIAVAALARARVHRDRATGERAAIAAAALIAFAALIYQGVVLAFGMLPLAAGWSALGRRRVIVAIVCGITVVPFATIAAQVSSGLAVSAAIGRTFGGETNPLARSFMSSHAPLEYVAALAAAPPQGFVWLPEFSGLGSMVADLRGEASAGAVADIWRLALGGALVLAMAIAIVRHRAWALGLAVAVLLALPLVRNEQYAYVKFFVLWPVPVALAALRYPARPIAFTAVALLAANGWVLASDVARGRQAYEATRATYAAALPSTCFFTTGWAPPFHYLWPGTTTGILGTLATGSDPEAQSRVLTSSIRRCFCGGAEVWTDATRQALPAIAQVTSHFGYQYVDVTTLLRNQRDSPA